MPQWTSLFAIMSVLLITVSFDVKAQASGFNCEDLLAQPDETASFYTLALAQGYSTASTIASVRAFRIHSSLEPIVSSADTDSLRASMERFKALDAGDETRHVLDGITYMLESVPDSLREEHLDEARLRAQAFRAGASFVVAQIEPLGPEATLGEAAARLRALCHRRNNKDKDVTSLLPAAFSEARQ